jgi:hypothetical protein
MATRRRYQDNVLIYKLTGQDDGTVLFELSPDSEVEYDLLKLISSSEMNSFSETGDIEDGLKKLSKYLRKTSAKIQKDWKIVDNETEGFTLASLKLKFPITVGFNTPTSGRTKSVPITPELAAKYEACNPPVD